MKITPFVRQYGLLNSNWGDFLVELLQELPADEAASSPHDRGKEFARHSEITEAMNGLQFYFPKLYAPWERGTGKTQTACSASTALDSLVRRLLSG